MKRFVVLAFVWAVFLLFVAVIRPARNSVSVPAAPAMQASQVAAAPRTSPSQDPFRLTSSPTKASPAQAAPPPTAPQPRNAFGAFDIWAEEFLAHAPSATTARGTALAWKRREALLSLIQTDPQRALSLAVPFEWRTALPAQVTRFFEQQVDGRGAFDVAMCSDPRTGQPVAFRRVRLGTNAYTAFVYGRRLRQPCMTSIPIHGIALEGNLALSDTPLRPLTPAEAAARGHAHRQEMCAVCGKPVGTDSPAVVAEAGGELMHFCSPSHQDLVNRSWTTAESGGTGLQAGLRSTQGDLWTHGEKTVLYMRVNFPDDLTEPISEANAYRDMAAVDDFYADGSYDMTSLRATVAPLVTLPEPKAWYETAGPFAVLTDAREATRQAGYDTANYDLDIVALTSVPGTNFSWGGLAFVGGKGTWLQGYGPGVTAHELGHNYGLMHANFWDASPSGSAIGQGTNVEYGNIYDTMGNAAAGNNQFNALFKNQLDWLPDTAVQNVTTSGVYRIYPFDVPNRVEGDFYAARVTRDFQKDYWLEFRQAFPGNPWLANGILLDWSPWDESDGGSQLLDMTQNSPPGSVNLNQAALVIGNTFADSAAGIYITPLQRGATGTNAWLDVQVNLGAFPDNQPPELTLEVESTNLAPGAVTHFHASAFDPDGDTLAYAWSFDHSAFSTNNLPWTFKSWSSPGEHVVRCVVSDMKGGTASANALVRVGNPPGFHITGQVLDTNGYPIEGVRVDNFAMTNAPSLVSALTDSNGRYILTSVTGDIELAALKDGFTFTNFTWTNPLTADSNLAGIDFVAIPLPAITVRALTNAIAENDPATNWFLLTRTGDTGTNLTVNLYLSGMAAVGSDYSLAPKLSAGTSSIDFPPGSNTVLIYFQTINDSLVEGPETATLTVMPDPTYTLGSLAAATVTIIDDDLPSQPSVAVQSTTPLLLENGTDAGQFVFTRSGDTGGDLLVYYSVSGTAVAGKDYSTLAGVVLIPAGQTAAAVPLVPIDNPNVEPDRTVVVTVTPNPVYNVTGSPAQTLILDDDLTTVTVFPTSPAAAEPSIPGRFTVQRQGDLSANLEVLYTVAGTATPGLDFVPLSGSVIIPAGAVSADIQLTPLDDTQLEGDESVIITLTNSPAYSVGTPASATLVIQDGQKPTVTIIATDPSASEPGDDFGTFKISRGSVVNGALTVYFSISGTALNGIDYVPLDNYAVIPDGSSSVTLNVIPFDDLQLEFTEDVVLILTPSTNYNLGSPAEARVTISDDDMYSVPAVGFTFSSSAAPERQSPGVSVSLSYTSSQPVTVNYRVIGGTASSNDYILPPPPLTFDPGELVKILPLRIKDNTVFQPDRTIRLALYDPTNATLDGIKLHTYTILDDDSANVSVAATVPIAYENGLVPGNFRISRNGRTETNLVVYFQLTGTASAPNDYSPLGNSVTIPAGASFVDLPVQPADDRAVELDESVVITLLNAPGANIVPPASAVVTISENDTNFLPAVTVTSTNGPTAVEGGKNGAFTFFRTSTNGDLTVSFTLTGSARNGVDYQSLPNSITVPDGQASISLPVAAVDDTAVQGERTVILSLTDNGLFHPSYPASAVVTLQDNDQVVRIDASDFNAAEPGSDAGEFTFTRFGTTNTDLLVTFTIGGTALNGIDYAALSNAIIIPAGSLSAVLPITVLDDPLVEGPETVVLSLQPGPGYAVTSPANATVTIMDDEPMFTVTATVPSVLEGSSRPGVFTITRYGNPKYCVTANLAVGGSATYGVDYFPFQTNVFFGCGVTAIDLSVSAYNELAVEGTETVTLSLLPDPAYTILAPSNAVIQIEDAGLNPGPLVNITSPKKPVVYLRGTNVNILLEATISSQNPASLTNWWAQLQGPDALFGSVTQANTTVSFTNQGIYVLRLTADDGQLQNYADLTVVVGEPQLVAVDNILYWNFNEGTGTVAHDSSGGGHDGILTGNPTWVYPGALGGALRFNELADSVRTTNAPSFLDGNKELTLALWLKPDLTNLDRGIFCADQSGTNTTLAIYSKSYSSCCDYSNVIEATLPTSRGMVRLVSANNAALDVNAYGWQHIAIVWKSGGSPVLYVNGQADQPSVHRLALSGYLTNCPGFIVGRGPADWPLSARGEIDEVLLYPRALSSTEIGGLAGNCSGVGSGGCFLNYGPEVDAGTNDTFQMSFPGILAGTASDDGCPDPPAQMITTWTNISGPVPVAVPNPQDLTNSIDFFQTGEYVFRLIADDDEVKTYDDVTLTVTEPTRIDVYASDPFAAELGPDPGEFTITRSGDLTYDLTVNFSFSGIASNGLDFATLINSVTFTGGNDTLRLTVTPYLDHRTEGDQDVTLTVLSNRAYSIGSGQATVIIQDSPYGQWTINHFTLEELTDPTMSGEGADFDHDGLVNLAEYAANLDPKDPSTNSPVAAKLEIDPSDNQPHISIVYQRRIAPTDVGTAVYVSNDLKHWQTGTNVVQELSATDDGNSLTETVRARILAPFSPATNQFVAVKVWLLTTEP